MRRRRVSIGVQPSFKTLPFMPRLGYEHDLVPRRIAAWLANAPRGRRHRKALRRLFVAACVLLGHVLFAWVIIAGHETPAPPQPASGAPIGIDLVGTAPTALTAPRIQTRAARPKHQTATAVVRDHATPAVAAPQPDAAASDVADILPTPASADAPPVLSDADAQALSQFQPASAQAGAGPSCNLTSALVRDFSQNPVVQQAVAELPAGEKSVANAVQMWDGAWPIETQSGGKALLRALLAREIAAAPADCLNQVNTGPVFFMVPQGAVTVVVAVGSGQWTWGQLAQ